MKDCSIVCFGKDWSESPTSNNHVMRQLSKYNKILWINSAGMRAPSMASRADLSKIIRKLKEHRKGIREINSNLNIYTPLAFPYWRFALVRKINNFFLTMQIKHVMKKLGMKDVQLWLFYPTVWGMIGKFNEKLTVYYCTDDWSQFSYLKKDLMISSERKLLSKVDIVFASSTALFDDKRKWHASVHLITHGVDFDFFSQVPVIPDDVCLDIRDLPKPIIGFYGLIQDWIDFSLIRKIAMAFPYASVVLIGKVAVDISSLKDIKNIHFLGEKPYVLLPYYSVCFDVAIIPYDIDDLRMQTVNPTKLRQYLASGLPVVTVDLPEVRPYRDFIYIADSSDTFIEKIQNALQAKSSESRLLRKESVRNESWTIKVDLISHIVSQKI